MIDHTHDPAAKSWVPGADDHPEFPLQNLPLGVFSHDGGEPRIGTAIGDHVLDLRAIAALLPALPLDRPVLNALFSLPATARRSLRHALFALLADPARADALAPHLHRVDAVTLHLPFAVGDYTDFYVGIHHATAIGRLFRPDNPLLPNYRHVPIGYHGRASSVRVSGTPVVRPCGQTLPPGATAPVFGPSARLDHELELGIWIAGENALGTPVPIARAWDRIGGLCLLNDWSARDIQAWEYQPLGPFLAKNFLTSVSPWVVTAEALAPFRTAPVPRTPGDPAPLAYLDDRADRQSGALAITLEAMITTPAMRERGLAPHRLSAGDAREAMYWTPAQLVAHHAVGGCDLHAGDLFGTGTLSGPQPGSAGSLIELTAGGRVPLTLPGGETRTFLADGDTLILAARAQAPGRRSIGFGTCIGQVVPARCG